MTLKFLIGVDAGGTHTMAIAYDLKGHELARAQAGPGQVNTNYASAITNITNAINKLIDEIDGDCQRILCGIAGLSVVGHANKIFFEIIQNNIDWMLCTKMHFSTW